MQFPIHDLTTFGCAIVAIATFSLVRSLGKKQNWDQDPNHPSEIDKKLKEKWITAANSGLRFDQVTQISEPSEPSEP